MGNSKLKKLAPIGFVKRMRSHPTDTEQKLWHELRTEWFASFKCRRQHIIGKYIVDFLCVSQKLIIEADGQYHDLETDQIRDDYLRSLRYHVMRFSNHDIQRHLPMVWDHIWIALHDLKFDPRYRPPSPASFGGTLSLKGEGK